MSGCLSYPACIKRLIAQAIAYNVLRIKEVAAEFGGEPGKIYLHFIAGGR
jgi:hypothetical protein